MNAYVGEISLDMKCEVCPDSSTIDVIPRMILSKKILTWQPRLDWITNRVVCVESGYEE